MLVTMRWETLIKFEKLSVKMSNFWCAYLLSKNDSKGSFVCLYSFERKKFCKLLNRLFWYMTTKNRICKVKDRKNGILFWCRNLQRHFEKKMRYLAYRYVHKYYADFLFTIAGYVQGGLLHHSNMTQFFLAIKTETKKIVVNF